MSHRTLFAMIGNDANLRGAHLTHILSNTLVTTATITFTVVVSGTANQVSGQTWPSSMSLINSETALWVGPLINSLGFAESGHYQALVTVDAGIGMKGFWRLPIKAIVRDE